MKNNIYESAYLNMLQNQKNIKEEQTLFDSNKVIEHTTEINKLFLTLEEELLEQQKELNDKESKQNLFDVQTCLNAIIKIKQALFDINNQTTTITDSLNTLEKL